LQLIAKKDSIDFIENFLYGEAKRGCPMIEKDLLCDNRMRKITGSFAFIEHRFLRDGFWASLGHHELIAHAFGGHHD